MEDKKRNNVSVLLYAYFVNTTTAVVLHFVYLQKKSILNATTRCRPAGLDVDDRRKGERAHNVKSP